MARIFSPSEERVIQALRRFSRWASANEVSKKSKMSWNTADKALENLLKRHVVQKLTRKTEKGERALWLLNL